ncbi:hypothetical protein BH11BAC7_BH11BAC7_20050 [soil metagenome]
MRSPEPVIVDVPTFPSDIDTSFYVFHILKNKIAVEHGGKKNDVGNSSQFNSFVKTNKIAMLKTRIVLQADSLYSYKFLDSVVQIFKEDSIVEYFLITDLVQ